MRQIACFAGLLLVGSSAFAADSQLMNLVMPDAQVMAGVNVVTAAISPFGQYVLTQIGSNDAGLQDFISSTGFDPRHDVTEILMASSGSPGQPGGLVLAKGTFNVNGLVASLAKGGSQKLGSYNGATLITSTDPKATYAVAFIDTSVALAGDLSLVKAAVDRRQAVNSVNPQLASLVQTLSSTEDAWSASLASIGALIPNFGGNAAQGPGAMTLQLVKNIQSSSGGVKFGSDIVITGQAVADTPQNATALADIIQMITSLASMGAAGQGGAGASAAQLLQKVKVSVDGSTVNLLASFPETDVEAVLKTMGAPPVQGNAKKARL